MRGGISFVLLVKATLDHRHRHHLDHPTTTSNIIIPFLRKKREKNRITPTTNDDRPPLPPPPPPSPVVASSSTYSSSSTLSPFADEVQLEKFVVVDMIDEDDDDRLDDGDSGGIAYQMRSITITPSSSSSSSSYNYAMLPPPAPPVEFRDANSGRNGSIEEHDWFGEFDGGGSRSRSSSAASFNTFFDLDDNNQNNNNTTFFDHHSSPFADDFHQHRSQNHNQSANAGALFSLDPLGVRDYDGESFSSVSDQSTEGALPEFVGSGGGQGIFKVPLRAPVHPDRPPSLELRSHPLRETQVGSFLRTIACTPSQLWAGQESGVRFWNFVDVFKGREEIWRSPLGDEESSPFHESRRHTSPTLCFAVDVANQLVWSGHKDGKIRSWRMDEPGMQGSSAASSSDGFFGDGGFGSNDDCNAATYFKEGLSWQAHRGPVLSLTFTSYGDLWSGSENGVIKAWPWEVIHKSLSLAMEERHMSALLVERSYVDLRSQVTVGGVCSLPSADVKFLLSDNSSLKVWSGGSLSFSLWNSRTKELLKVFSIDGQIETRVDIPSGHELYIEDDLKVKFVSTSSKKEKSQGPMSFFQRSRNVLMGAADVVRRVATKGTFGDDNRKTEAITMSMDGMIWTGCANGALVQWDGNGNRSQEFQHHSSSVQCLCSFGSRLWVGYLNGSVHVLDLEGNLLGGWVAHSSPVINMAVGGGYIFTLANHGGIRGWNLNSPWPVDDILKLELTNKELSYTKLENIKILVGSWNVGQERASHDSLISWIGCSASEAAIVVVGLQEVEMGAGFLAMAAAKETVGLEGSANGHWWLDTIGKTLDEGTTFERVGSRQLAGLLISVWARKNLRRYIGDVDAGAVPCGFGRAIGNKGSVGLKMRVYGKIFCFLNCHFAAHLEAVNRRNSDFDHVYRAMSFSRPSNAHYYSGAGSSSAVQLLRGLNVTGLQSDDGKPELSEADMIVFLGDLNYRLQGISYDEARDFVSQRCFDWLREKDQLRSEMKAGRVFQGMREGIIRFPPTYKFERHQIGLAGYDSGEKKRIPAWCDRILYRDSHSISTEECFLSGPVAASILQYGACMDVTDSDHKPVRCLFDVNIARVDELVRRQEFGQIFMANEKIRSSLEESSSIPETIVSTNNLILQNKDKTILRITNKCNINSAIFEISCDGQSSIMDDGYPSEHYPRGAFGFPRWLEVTPAAGIIKPGQTMEVSVQHEEFQTTEEFVDGVPQNLWCEDTRDKEVRMVVNVSGSFSTERRSHHIDVCHCFSSKTSSNKLKDSSRAVQSNIPHRSDFRHISTVIDDMRYLHNF